MSAAKIILIYWVLGCALVGLPYGRIITECPKFKADPGQVIETVATWPVVIFMGLARIGEPPLPKTGCEAQP